MHPIIWGWGNAMGRKVLFSVLSAVGDMPNLSLRSHPSR